MRTVIAIFLALVSTASNAEFYPVPNYIVYGSPAIRSDGDAIDRLMQQFKIAWASQDASAVADTHSSDAEWTNAFGRVFRGSESLEEFLAQDLFPDYPIDVSRSEMANFMPISRRYTSSDSVVIQAYTTSGRGSALSGTERMIFFNFVLAKSGDDWKIVHQTISDIRERRN